MATPLMFSSVGYALPFWAAFYVWCIPEIVGAFRQRATGGGAAGRDRGSQGALIGGLWAGVFLAFALAWNLPVATIGAARPLVFWAGVVAMVCGVALRWWAIRVLGRFFTRNLAVREDQRVVESGPYRLVRHPAYSGTLLTMLGMGLAMTNWASLLAVVGLSLAGYLYRVGVEERMLAAELGEPYREYMRRTRRFVPYLF